MGSTSKERQGKEGEEEGGEGRKGEGKCRGKKGGGTEGRGGASPGPPKKIFWPRTVRARIINEYELYRVRATTRR